MISVFVAGGLPLELEVGFFHLFEGELHALPGSGFKSDHARVETLERPGEVALIFHGLAQNHLNLLPDEALKLAGLGELALDARRADFEPVARSRHHIFDVEDGPDVVRDEFAVGQGNALRRGLILDLPSSLAGGLPSGGWAVDKNAQNPVAAAADEIDIDNLDAFLGANPLRDFDYFVYDSLTVRHLALPLITDAASQ